MGDAGKQKKRREENTIEGIPIPETYYLKMPTSHLRKTTGGS
jgi:hypothetical protein